MNILEAQEILSGKKSVRPFSLPPVGAAPLIAPAGPATAPAAASAPVISSGQAESSGNQVPATSNVQDKQSALQKKVSLPSQEVPEQKSGIIRKYVGDPAVWAVKGLSEVTHGLTGLVDIPTKGYFSKGLEKLGWRPDLQRAFLDSLISPERRKSREAVTEAEGFANKVATAIQNPSVIAQMAVESAPGMVAGGNIARGLLSKFKSLPPLVAAAIGEGAMTAGGMAQQVRRPGESLDVGQIGYSVGAGTATALLSVVGGGIARRLGIDDVDVLLSGAASQKQKQNILVRAIKGALSEGVLEELPQSLQEQIAQNKATGRPWDEGVAEGGALGMLTGMVMGGGANVFGKSAYSEQPAQAPDPNAPPVNPLLNPEAAQGPSVFDAPIGTAPAAPDAATANQQPVNPLLATNQPTTNAEDEATVRKAMASRGEAYAGFRAVEPPPSAAVGAVKEVSDKMGVKVIWIDGAPVGGRAIQGAAIPGENTILLHTDLLTNPKRDPVMMVYAHELTHRSEKASPKEYGILRDSVLARPEAAASVEEKVASGMSRAAAESEAVAEQVEVLGTDQAFWSEVFAGKEQSFIEHIIQIVTEMAERVFGTNQAAKAEQIRGAAVAAFQALQAKNQAQATSQINVQGQAATINQQEAANGLQVQGQAQEVAQAIEPMAADVAKAPAAKPAPEEKPAAPEAARPPIEQARAAVDAVPPKADGSVDMEARQRVLDEWKQANPEAVREIEGRGSNVSAVKDGPFNRWPDGSIGDGYSIREDGKWVGELTLRIDPDGTATIGQITMAGGKHPIGVRGLRAVRDAIKKDYPQITVWQGDRTTGARTGREQQRTRIADTDRPSPLTLRPDGKLAGAAKAAKAAGESRQQGLPEMEGLAKSPYGTPDDGASGTLFSAKKIEPDNAEGTGREREYSISRYFREELKREWSRTYKQKSAQQAIGELQAITEKHGEDWVMDHLFDLSKETQAEFPMALRPLAARHIIESADKAFRAWGINDDGSNLPGNPAIDNLWLKIEDLRNKAAAYEREGGRGMAWLRSTYEANNINSPLGVRKTVNKLHDKLAAPVIGPVKAPVIEKAIGESKTAYDEAIAALEAERAKNAELEENLRILDEALGKRIGQNEARIKKRSAKSEAYRRGIDEDLAATMAELKAAGISMEGLSSKPTIEMIQKAVKLYIGIHGADEAKVSAFLDRNLGEKLAPATVKALINDAQLALDNAGRAAEKAAQRKQTSKTATAPRRRQRLFDSGKMWGKGRVLNIGEADAKRLARELTEAGQTVMRGISSNVEVVISNALRHGRNAAGIEKVLIDSGIDPDTARRMAKNIVKRRAELVRPALETLRQKYAAKGDKVSRTIASAMDKIMSAMELADRASTSQVSGFFDGNAWDESRRIIEEAFGFKSEITRDWFNETMRIYREYERADEAGNHLRASMIHSEMLHRVARVQNGTGASLAVRSYIQGGMLWGPQTHWWNFFNTASRNIDAANAASIEQMWKAATAEKGKKLDYLKAAFAPWAIMGMSHKQAWGVAKYILKTGVNPLAMRIGDESKFGTDPKVASAPEWHPFFKKLGMRPFKYVGRALIAADAYFRTNIENTDIYLQAYNAAISRGESAPVAAKQALGMIGFVTDGTNEAYNEAARKADEAGLKGADREMNIRIELMNKLDPDMRDHAQKQGAVETFNDQNPEGLAGWMADALRHHSSDPIIFYLGMFARIGANVFNYGLQTNPITGFLSLAKDSKFGRYKAGKTNVKLTPEERVRRTIRATQGLAITGTVLAMALSAAKDYDEDDDPNKKLKFGVSAIGPRDPAARKLWRQQHKPFMLTINGKEISYKWIAPLATPLALAGAIMDEIRFGSLKDAETNEAREESFLSALLPTMIMGLMSITTDELPGQGMVKFADMIYSGGQGGAQSLNAWNRFFQQQAASLGTAAIPYSALVRYFDRVYDPTVYTPNSIDGLKMYPYAFLRNMPFLRKAALYPMRNIFGDPIQTPDRGSEQGIGERATRLMFDRFLNNMVEDPDIQFLTKVQRGFNAPSRKETRIVTNENGLYGLRNLTDAEYDRFLEIFGKELRTQIATIRKDYSSSAEIEKWATPQNKALRKRLEDARSTAMNWAMYKFLTETGKQVVRSKE